MLDAVIRGKLNVADGAEDALTATVFGLLSAAPWEVGLGAWLGTAAPFSGSGSLAIPRGEPSITLWPTFDEEGGTGCEPDVLLRWPDGARMLVECKLDSPPSSVPSNLPAVTGQLGRQWLAARRACGSPLTLVYVTKHWTMPLDVMDAHVGEVERKVNDIAMRPSLFWLPWRTLLRTLTTQRAHDATAARLSTRVCAYLRWLDLACFHGFHGPADELPSPWAYRGGLARFHGFHGPAHVLPSPWAYGGG